MDKNAPVITIDGPAAVGKGTVAREVARQTGFTHLDSGRFYRAMAAIALRAEADVEDPAAILAAADKTLSEPGALERMLPTPWLDGEKVGQAASKVAMHKQVRDALLAPLRAFRRMPGIVADGRDMGSIVFTDATLKVFLDASAKEREARMLNRARKLGDDSSTMSDYLERFRERDARDMGRRLAPVEPAKDAQVINTDGLSVADTVNKVLALYADASA